MTNGLPLFSWEADGRYRVAFSTRAGGASEGAFASLNLGMLTDDLPEHVHENRRRLCEAVGIDPERATMARQQHAARVARARPHGLLAGGASFPPCDALWSRERGRGMLLITADCLPIAIARADGEPALALVHAGWRGLLAGVVAAAAAALGGGRLVAAVGPAIGPCCYEVGDEVREPFRRAYGAAVIRGRTLDLWRAGELALRAAGCTEVERLDLCTACHPDLFFSHRRDRGRTGRQGVIGAVE
jgi:YfiH family protein